MYISVYYVSAPVVDNCSLKNLLFYPTPYVLKSFTIIIPYYIIDRALSRYHIILQECVFRSVDDYAVVVITVF